MFATNVWFFKEGPADAFAKAKCGQYRVSADGDAIL